MQKLQYLVIAITLFHIPLKVLATAPQQTQLFDYADVFELEYAASIQPIANSPMVIYERRSMDIMTDSTRYNLWSVDTKTKAHKPVLSGADNFRLPRISQDGKRLAYISGAEGSNQLYVRDLNDGATVRVTNIEHSPSSISWSPDGKWLAFIQFVADKPTSYFKATPHKPKNAQWAEAPKTITSTSYRNDGGGYREPGFSHIFIVPSEGGTPRQLTTGSFNHGGNLTWSADSKTIYYAAVRDANWALKPMTSNLYALDIEQASITNLTNDNGSESAPQVSPDGQSIAFLWVNDNKMSYQLRDLVVMDIDGKNRRVITSELDRAITDIQWAPNSNSVFVSFLDNGLHRLAEYNLDGTHAVSDIMLGGQSLGRPYTSGEFAVLGNGNIVYTLNHAQRPADLALSDKSGITQLTELNHDLLAHKQLAEVKSITVNSSVDNRPIQAWYALPPNFDATQSYPLILEIHGGPHTAYGPGFATEVQLMAAKGYVVVWANPRGSTSYGTEFANLIHHNYPSQDYNDLMDVVDTMSAKEFVDNDNLFITGGSGGGVLTAWSIGKTDRFNAAVVAKPVINWISFTLTADAYPFFSQYWMEDMPWNIADKLWARSPLSLVGNVNTPTMLLTGEADYRTPISETEQYYQALQLRQVPSAMVRIPGASHGIASRPSRLIQKVGNILGWFEKYRTQASGKE